MRHSMWSVWLLGCGLAGFLGAGADLEAGDWPQILGPQRNGIAEDERIATRWPNEGPPVKWERQVGNGFAGLAVADGIAILFHRVGNEEIVEAHAADSGKSLWKRSFPTDYSPSIITDNGPRAVPLIDRGRVYVFGVQGGLRSLDLKSGKLVWERETHQDYQAPEGYFGAGSSPIVEEDRILVNVGGARQEAGIVAFSVKDGRTVWKQTGELASYSSPVATTVGGQRQVIFVTRLNAVGLDPKNGNILFQFPFGQRGPTVNGANPLVIDGHLFLTASYGIGAVFAKISPQEADILWSSDDLLSSQYTTPIFDQGVLYGIDGRQDVGEARLRCIDPKSRKIHWSEDGFGYASLIKADGKLLLLTTDGQLVLAALNSSRYQELDRSRVFSGTARALPALSNGLLFARDEQTLKCLDLSVQD